MLDLGKWNFSLICSVALNVATCLRLGQKCKLLVHKMQNRARARKARYDGPRFKREYNLAGDSKLL